MRKVCIFTGGRAEYGLLRPLLKELNNDPNVELQLLVSGMHLSNEFGLTYQEIEKDGYVCNEKVEMVLSSDTPSSIVKSMGLGIDKRKLLENFSIKVLEFKYQYLIIKA